MINTSGFIKYGNNTLKSDDFKVDLDIENVEKILLWNVSKTILEKRKFSKRKNVDTSTIEECYLKSTAEIIDLYKKLHEWLINESDSVLRTIKIKNISYKCKKSLLEINIYITNQCKYSQISY